MKMSDRQLTLGALIDALRHRHATETVVYDFCGLAPTTLCSYRGYYEDLALGFTNEMGWGNITVGTLLERLQSAIGQTFTGWKGGDYVASPDTAMWVATQGETGGTAIVGVRDGSYYTILETDLID